MTTPVGPRVPKEEFMRALGLNPSDSHAEGIYRSMRDHAIEIYNQIIADRTSLKEEQQRDPGVQPPFFWHHIREDRREAAIRQTWQNARHGTIVRHYFDQGATSGDHKPNWVTQWLLYSVFRSRDIRNNRNRRHADSSRSDDRTSRHPPSSNRIYDPARNQYVSR